MRAYDTTMEQYKIEQLPRTRAALRQFYKYLRRDFPRNERIPYFAFAYAVLRSGVLRPVLLLDGDMEVGYMVYSDVPGHNLTNIAYFAVHPRYRSGGHGSRFLRLFRQQVQTGLLLEVEDPDTGKTPADKDLRMRRIAFYQRNGFRLAPGVKLRVFGVSNLLMLDTDVQVDDWKALYRRIYSRLLNRNSDRHVV